MTGKRLGARARIAAIIGCLLFTSGVNAVDHVWTGDGSDDDWHNASNWSPTAVPGNNDTADLSDTSNGSVVILSDDTGWIDSLTVENGFTLDTNGHLLGIDDASSAETQIDGADSRIIVDERTDGSHLRGFDTDILRISDGGCFHLSSGRADIDVQATVSLTGEIAGNGTVRFLAGSGQTALRNNGTIRVSGAVPGALEKTLTLSALNGASFDLDGAFLTTGILDVDDGTGMFSGNMTLVIDAQLTDSFGGWIEIGQGDTVDFRQVCDLAGGKINFRGADGVATLKSGTMGIDNSMINVHSGTAVFDTGAFIGSNSIIDVDATLQIDGTVGLWSTCDLDLNGADALIVNGSLAVNQEIIDLDGDSDVLEITVGSDGLLTLNVDQIDDEGTLFGGTMRIYGGKVDANVTGGWGADGVIRLYGGELTGTTFTNNQLFGLFGGYGSITTDGLENNGGIRADGGTLILDSPNDTMDLDGATNAGTLNAVDGSLDVREGDITFEGTLNVGNGRLFLVDGSLMLDDIAGPGVTHMAGGTIHAGGLMALRGTMVVDTAPSTLAAGSEIHFSSGSHTTINTDLTLESNYRTLFYSGATIAGTGTLINPSNTALILGDGIDTDVAVHNEGSFYVHAGDPGSVRVGQLTIAETGNLTIDVHGPNAADADWLGVDTTALLDGPLRVWRELDGGVIYEPSGGESWEIIHADGGISGEFDGVDSRSGPLADRLFWHVEYDTPGNRVVLHVLEYLEADFDEDTDVDSDDFDDWQSGFGTTAAANHGDGDADGDADVDGADFLTWQRQFGSSNAAGASSFQAVPEPTAIVLAAMLALCLAIWRSGGTS